MLFCHISNLEIFSAQTFADILGKSRGFWGMLFLAGKNNFSALKPTKEGHFLHLPQYFKLFTLNKRKRQNQNLCMRSCSGSDRVQ